MISRKIVANTLPEYYEKLCALQVSRHKDDYLLVHGEIRKRLEECDTYTEFGINQGATLAAAMLQNPKVIRAYDISLKWYNKARHLFEEYAAAHDINYKVFEASTLTCTIEPVELLYVDTAHKYGHLVKELKRHGSRPTKYIIFHDTAAKKDLAKGVREFVRLHKEWSIVVECTQNVGFTTIQKTTNET